MAEDRSPCPHGCGVLTVTIDLERDGTVTVITGCKHKDHHVFTGRTAETVRLFLGGHRALVSVVASTYLTDAAVDERRRPVAIDGRALVIPPDEGRDTGLDSTDLDREDVGGTPV